VVSSANVGTIFYSYKWVVSHHVLSNPKTSYIYT
jgi:hypothetical protein